MKRKFKHTSGEWSVPHFARPEIGCDCEYVLDEHHMGAVASVHYTTPTHGSDGDNPPLEEAISNAFLIAAAPKMLEALVDVEQYFKDNDLHDDFIGGMLLKQIRKAIRLSQPHKHSKKHLEEVQTAYEQLTYVKSKA